MFNNKAGRSFPAASSVPGFEKNYTINNSLSSDFAILLQN
jgi:hypothetical protein